MSCYDVQQDKRERFEFGTVIVMWSLSTKGSCYEGCTGVVCPCGHVFIITYLNLTPQPRVQEIQSGPTPPEW